MGKYLADPAIPKHVNGGIALCPWCQRAMYFAGGFLELLRRSVEHYGTGNYYARANKGRRR